MKRILSLLAVIFILLFSTTFAYAREYVIDEAGVLSDSERISLNEKLLKLSEKNKCDIVVATVFEENSSHLMTLADNIFDENNFGFGSNKDGVLLLTNVYSGKVYEKGNSWISTSGKCIKTINNEDIQKIGQNITPLLLNGNFFEAFSEYSENCASEISWEKTKKILTIIGIALFISLIVSFIYVKKLKNALISVGQASNANDYMVSGSRNIVRSYDHYLYSTVSRTEKPSSSSSSSHTSSSGSTHGGGGF